MLHQSCITTQRNVESRVKIVFFSVPSSRDNLHHIYYLRIANEKIIRQIVGMSEVSDKIIMANRYVRMTMNAIITSLLLFKLLMMPPLAYYLSMEKCAAIVR